VSLLTFYDFIALIIPGTALLIGLALLFDVGSLRPLLVPEDLGAFGAHLVIAYMAGHTLQALGNLIEGLYWRAWGGTPTDWPITAPKRSDHKTAVDTLARLTGVKAPKAGKKTEWRSIVSAARAALYAKDVADRLQVFNATYGMFRGIVAALVIIAAIGWMSRQVSPLVLYPTIFVIAVACLYRMHRFAVHYAGELFSTAKAILPSIEKKGAKNGG
jgi:hypothetical protein